MRVLRVLSLVGVAAAVAAPAWTQPAMTGTVQSAPKNRQFTILSQLQGHFTVDASKAQFRQFGRVVSPSMIKPGQVVTAYGTRTGGRIKANEVCICPATPTKEAAVGSTPGTRVAGYRSGGPVVLGVTGTITGMSGDGSLSVLSRRDGTFTVNTKGATVRRYGNLTSKQAIKTGLVIRAYGTRKGKNVTAKEICICPATPKIPGS